MFSIARGTCILPVHRTCILHFLYVSKCTTVVDLEPDFQRRILSVIVIEKVIQIKFIIFKADSLMNSLLSVIISFIFGKNFWNPFLPLNSFETLYYLTFKILIFVGYVASSFYSSYWSFISFFKFTFLSCSIIVIIIVKSCYAWIAYFAVVQAT